MQRLDPCHDWLVVTPDKPETHSKGGIELPHAVRQKKLTGTVLAVGPGHHLAGGLFVKPDFEVGDRIFYSQYVGKEAPFHNDETGEELFLVQAGSVIAKILDDGVGEVIPTTAAELERKLAGADIPNESVSDTFKVGVDDPQAIGGLGVSHVEGEQPGDRN